MGGGRAAIDRRRQCVVTCGGREEGARVGTCAWGMARREPKYGQVSEA